MKVTANGDSGQIWTLSPENRDDEVLSTSIAELRDRGGWVNVERWQGSRDLVVELNDSPPPNRSPHRDYLYDLLRRVVDRAPGAWEEAASIFEP